MKRKKTPKKRAKPAPGQSLVGALTKDQMAALFDAVVDTVDVKTRDDILRKLDKDIAGTAAHILSGQADTSEPFCYPVRPIPLNRSAPTKSVKVIGMTCGGNGARSLLRSEMRRAGTFSRTITGKHLIFAMMNLPPIWIKSSARCGLSWLRS
ncbi:MAG: hypothetical protein JRJ47_08260 [Deltaproteobacteria bacterium]|nr:hypothetical protein [Deltaproteobacteria bacterium]